MDKRFEHQGVGIKPGDLVRPMAYLATIYACASDSGVLLEENFTMIGHLAENSFGIALEVMVSDRNLYYCRVLTSYGKIGWMSLAGLRVVS